jgi:hypothetical protein
MVQQTSDNKFGVAKWIVDSTLSLGTHSTIAAAITSASSGDTIFIRPGTYTENLTLKVGVNLCAFICDSITPNVIIAGNCTLSTAGTVSISGIRLQTNSAALLTVSGSVASIVNLDNCYLNCTNATGISFTSSSASAQINITNCKGDLGTTGIAPYSHSSSGTMTFRQTNFSNSGGSTTAATCSAGVINATASQFNSPITFSGTGACSWEYCGITTTPTNTLALTLGGGSTAFHWCRIASGTAQAVSVTSAANSMIDCFVSTSNATAIGGAGTLSYTPISFALNSSTTVSVTTQNILGFGSNVPGFSATKSANTTNVTGIGTVYTVICDTETYDTLGNYNNATGTFTAPIDGKYEFIFKVYITGCTNASSCTLGVVTTARTYTKQDFRAAGAQDFGTQITCIANMSAGNTATFTVSTFGEAGDTDDVLGNNTYAGTWVQGRWLGTN